MNVTVSKKKMVPHFSFQIRMAEVQVRVKHNIATYDLALGQEESLGSLAQKLMDLTGEYCYHRTVKVHGYII